MTLWTQLRRAAPSVLVASALAGCPDVDELGECRDCASADSAADGPDPICEADALAYNDLDDTIHWSTFDLRTLDVRARVYSGGVFDGKHVYLVPSGGETPHGLVVRHDTTLGSFATGWSIFDTATLHPAASGFSGGVYDGRHVYFFPFASSVVVRFDTLETAGFGLGSKGWEVFDLGGVDPNAKGFLGGTFDGRYVYLASGYNAATNALCVRYDTQSSFTTASAWSKFDTSVVDAGATSYTGAIYDGTYVHFLPYGTGVIARFDPSGAFDAAGSWQTFDIKTLDPRAFGFRGGGFDGRYLYLAPSNDLVQSASQLVARHDTNQPLEAGWSFADLSPHGPDAAGYWSTAFDGRHIYFVPELLPSSRVARYDTEKPFEEALESWSVFDLANVHPAAHSYIGAVFDGRHLYFAPADYYGEVSASRAVRFDAKCPASMPAGYSGSFY